MAYTQATVNCWRKERQESRLEHGGRNHEECKLSAYFPAHSFTGFMLSQLLSTAQDQQPTVQYCLQVAGPSYINWQSRKWLTVMPLVKHKKRQLLNKDSLSSRLSAVPNGQFVLTRTSFPCCFHTPTATAFPFQAVEVTEQKTPQWRDPTILFTSRSPSSREMSCREWAFNTYLQNKHLSTQLLH